MLIGFIGQGWIGKNYADDFENRGYSVVRYGLEEKYAMNKDEIKKCDIVFIAVPTPTVFGKGFDDTALREAMLLVGQGKTAVIKSTIVPGTTEKIQESNPQIYCLHSPEFLSEATAVYDASHPVFNIVGIPQDSGNFRTVAQDVLSVLPFSSTQVICSSREAEIFKYLRNCFFYTKVIYMNMVFDFADMLGAEWGILRDLLRHDPWIADQHLDPIHKSGRGAGGNCFIKDFAAFSDMYSALLPNDNEGIELLRVIMKKNLALLKQSNKDSAIVKEVYEAQ
jgi:UDPglucose 6-dehydrogenase